MDAVKRYQVADYLNTAKSGTESFALMGVGFNTLDESPNAEKDSKTYINQKSQTSTIKSYQPAFAFDSDLIADEAAVMALYEIGRNDGRRGRKGLCESGAIQACGGNTEYL